jgi:hypothetical protein
VLLVLLLPSGIDIGGPPAARPQAVLTVQAAVTGRAQDPPPWPAGPAVNPAAPAPHGPAATSRDDITTAVSVAAGPSAAAADTAAAVTADQAATRAHTI